MRGRAVYAGELTGPGVVVSSEGGGETSLYCGGGVRGRNVIVAGLIGRGVGGEMTMAGTASALGPTAPASRPALPLSSDDSVTPPPLPTTIPPLLLACTYSSCLPNSTTSSNTLEQRLHTIAAFNASLNAILSLAVCIVIVVLLYAAGMELPFFVRYDGCGSLK